MYKRQEYGCKMIKKIDILGIQLDNYTVREAIKMCIRDRVSERMQEVYIPEIRDEIPGEWADRKISYRMRQCKKVSKRNRYVFPVFTLIQTII